MDVFITNTLYVLEIQSNTYSSTCLYPNMLTFWDRELIWIGGLIKTLTLYISGADQFDTRLYSLFGVRYGF